MNHFNKNAKKKKKEEALLREGDEWESGRRGSESKIASSAIEDRLNSTLDLEMISLRLPVKTLDALRKEATEKGIKYQPYIRQLLVDHVQGTKDLESRVQRLEKKVGVG